MAKPGSSSSVAVDIRLCLPVLLAMAGAVMISAPAAHASVIISTGVTQNMSCAGGVCSPTAINAVLNVTDLESLLAAGNAKVTTTGSGVQASDIVVDGAFSWTTANTLTLDAYRSISIKAKVSADGTSGLALQIN